MTPNRETLQGRLSVLWMALSASVVLLTLRLTQVQVLKRVYYTRAAERNRTQLLRQTAPRGRIVDRHGEVLATNQAVFSLIYMPGKERGPGELDRLARDLAPHLRQDPEQLLKTLLKAIREESAIRLAEKLPSKTMFKLSELRTLYPGVNLVVEARRYYPLGAFASHLIGYLGRMDEPTWSKLKRQGYRVDSWIGRAGIERLFEADFRGQDGGIRMEVDARGRLKRVLERVPWKAGSNIRLTLDARLQKAAEDALRESPSGAGAAVVLDPRDGAVLALASIPDYDPNLFLASGGESAEEAPKAVPEFNLAVQGSFPPGSTFKIVTGAAMLDEDRVSPKDSAWCPGYFELGNRVFLCWEPKGHRTQSWISGLANSCDVYFYRMGLKVGADAIERYARMFRLGEKTLIGLSGESPGHPSGPRSRRARGASWYDGDTLNLAIGQGDLLVTPVQMATVMAAVANRGTLWRPHFIDRIEYADGRPPYRRKPEELGRVRLKDSTWELLHAGLVAVVREGTGRRVQLPGLVVAGKTGTAQNPGGQDHAWFVAYAGREGEDPSVALAVLGYHAGHGAEAAGPVARRILETAFGLHPPAPPAAAAGRAPAPTGALRGTGLPVPVR